MRNSYAVRLLLLGTMTISSLAGANTSDVNNINQQTNSATIVNVTATALNLSEGAAYEFKTPVRLVPYAFEDENGSKLNTAGLVVELDSVIFAGQSITAQGQRLVRIQRDSENGPDDLYFLASELPVEHLTKVADAQDPELITPMTAFNNEDSSTIDEEDTAAFEGPLLETMEARRHGGHRARRGRGGSYCTTHPSSKGCCFSAVKGMLMRMGVVSHRLVGVHAYQASSQLRGSHWREVGCGARNRPTWALTCTYRGGAHGHVETYNRGWYYGAYWGARHMSSPKRVCVSCKAYVR